jgi:hypothetical protein
VLASAARKGTFSFEPRDRFDDRDRIRLLPWISVALELPSSVVPGQPIQLTWEVWSRLMGLDFGSVTARILLGGNELFVSAPVPYQVNSIIGRTGPQPATIVAPANRALADQLYRIGTKDLEIEVTASAGAERGPFREPWPLTVVPELVNASWFEWSAPRRGNGFAQKDWKESYQVAGTLKNQSMFSRMTASVTLYENEQGSTSRTARGTQTTPALNPLGAADVTFEPPIEQDWLWLVPGIWTPIKPLFKFFVYTVSFTLSDEYGNAYSGVEKNDLVVDVHVPKQKIDLATSAAAFAGAGLGLIAASIAFAWFPPVAGALAGAGGALLGVAGGLGGAALDPPVPDPRYREPVEVKPTELPTVPDEDAAAQAAYRVAALAADIVGCLDALSIIEGRILGAEQACDEEAGARQRAAKRETLARLDGDAKQIWATIDACLKAFDAKEKFPVGPALVRELRRLRKAGVPAKARRIVVAKASSLLGKLLRDPRAHELAERGLAHNLTEAAIALERACAAIVEKESKEEAAS